MSEAAVLERPDVLEQEETLPELDVRPEPRREPVAAARKVRVAFVGTGGIAAYHLENLVKIPDAEVVAICDIRAEATQKTADRLAGQGHPAPRLYTDYREMLGVQPMDALYVCVPPFAHADAEILAARRGVHLFVEKPVALQLEKALEILDEVEKAGILTATGYLLRYWASTRTARTYLAGKRVSLVACNRWSGIPGGPEFWWRDMNKSGGQLHEMTTHQVDLMRHLAGEIVRVDARHSHGTVSDLPNVSVPDSQVALLEFESGAIGYVSNSCVLTRGGHQSRLEFVLRDQVLRWGETLELDPPLDENLLESLDGTLNIDEAFIRAVHLNEPELILSPYVEAVRTMAVTVAALESAVTRKGVEIQTVR